MAQRDVVGLRVMGWTNRLIVRLMPVTVGLLVFVTSLASPQRPAFALGNGATTFGSGRWPALLSLGVAAGLAAALGNRWRWPLFALAVLGWLTFSMWSPAMAAAYYGAVSLKRRRDSVIFLALAVSLVLAPFLAGAVTGSDFQIELAVVLSIAVVLVIVMLPYFVGLWVKARREVVAGLRDRASRLELEQAVRAEQARTEERERIAREMHDVLAHRVSLMVLHAGALEVSGSDERVAEEAALIRTTGRAALIELRQVLGVLRAGSANSQPLDLAPQPLLTDVDSLVTQARAAGLAITSTSEGAPRDLPATAERAAFRVIQEALTNVAKHASGAAATISLHWLPDALELTVESDPPLRRVEPTPGGFGLVGLRERVELLHGQFEARRRLDGGFVVKALIPAQASR